MLPKGKRWIPYVFILPNVLIVLAFAVYPLVSNFLMSFTDGPIGTVNFIGFKNYIQIWNDRSFKKALLNTLYYTFLMSVPTLILSLLLAVGLNSVKRFKSVLRAVYLLPHLFSWVVIGLIWKWIYSSNYGIINSILAKFGSGPMKFLLDPDMTLPCLAITGIWAGVGYYMVIFLAGLQSISSTYYEASQIDGANRIQQFWYITIPSLRPIIIIVVNLVIIASFRVFDQIYIMTGGGPGRASFVMVLYIYIKGMQEGKMGYASALSVVFFIILLALTLLIRKIIPDSDDIGKE